MTDKPISQEVWPDKPPVCAGCGREVDPRLCETDDDFRLYCGMCVARRKREENEARRAANAA